MYVYMCLVVHSSLEIRQKEFPSDAFVVVGRFLGNMNLSDYGIAFTPRDLYQRDLKHVPLVMKFPDDTRHNVYPVSVDSLFGNDPPDSTLLHTAAHQITQATDWHPEPRPPFFLPV